MSDIKNWVFLILLVNLILLPVMWVAQSKNTGQVLGVRDVAGQESSTDSGFGKWFKDNFSGSKPVSNRDLPINPSLNSSDLPARTPTGLVNQSDGIKTTLNKEPSKTVDGKVVVRDGFKGTLSVKDFSVGDKLTIKCGDKVSIATVDSTFLGLDNVVAVASPIIFTQLGADPNNTKELMCSLSKV
jgi:hypothetical protein